MKNNIMYIDHAQIDLFLSALIIFPFCFLMICNCFLFVQLTSYTPRIITIAIRSDELRENILLAIQY